MITLGRYELETASSSQMDIVRMLTSRLCKANDDNDALCDQVADLQAEVAALKAAQATQG